jgi:putative transposase
MFCTMLKYKAEMEGKIYQEVDRFFPSSKTCHVCLNQVGSLPLDIRTWTCEHCKTTHDRDVNAAINLLTQVASYATLVDLPPGDRSRARLEVIDFLVLPVR